MKTLALWQRFALWVLGALLGLAVSVYISVGILNGSIFNREFVSSVVTSRGFYDVLSVGVAAGVNGEQSSADNAIDVEDVQNILNDSLDYSRYQASAQTFIDSLFDWLEGTTEDIDFSVQLFESEEELRATIVALIATKLEDLPECQTIKQAQQAQEDFLNAECKPPGLGAQEIEETLARTDDGALSELYQQSSVTDESTGINDQLNDNARKGYKVSHDMPTYMIFVFLSIAALVYLVLKNTEQLLRFLGRNLMRSSAVALGVGLLVFLVAELPSRIAIEVTREELFSGAQTSLVEVATLFEQQMVQLTLVYGGVVFGFGLVLYLGARRMKGMDHVADEHAVEKQTSVSSLK